VSGDRDALVAAPSQTVGPFFHFALAADDRLGRLAGPGCEGERLGLTVRVTDGEGAPVPDALLEIWHADAAGRYPRPRGNDGAAEGDGAFIGFGRLGTNETGTCRFDTIRPGPVTDLPGGRQAAHINVAVFARGLNRHLFTRIYFAGDPALDGDPFLQLVPADRRHTLTARPSADGEWVFDLRLQGTDETVFFDL
jgi:protocatechuate 3,4-dioxygenase alpha subunit